MNADKNFDIIRRIITVGGRRSCMFFVDGFVKDEVMEKVMEFYYAITPEDLPEDSHGFCKDFVPYVEVGLEGDVDKIITNILSGQLCLFIDGYDQCIAMDIRTYPTRGVDEPEQDKVLRGSRDGFVETLVFNTALIRRRIRDPKLSMEIFSVGTASKTDVVVCSMDGRCDPDFLAELKRRIQAIQVDSLTMNQQSLAECLYPHKWYNPFPKFKYSERPDTAAASVLEGNIVVLVDNSPACMILPTSLFDIVEEADDYYFPPITGTYLRLSRLMVAALTFLITPTFLLFMQNPQWLPEWLTFTLPTDPIYVPFIVQLLILEFAIDGLRLAALNTPSMLTTALSVVAAIVLGDFAVSSGWFNKEPLLYMAFVSIASYSQPSFELGYALKFMRMLALVLTFFFDLYGYIAGIVILLLAISLNKTISGKSYLYPLFPFHWKAFKKLFIRNRLRGGYHL
nr:spore germination protein [Zongyangia hominis]